MAALLSVAMVHFLLVLLGCSSTTYMATNSARMMVFVGPIPHGAICSWMSRSQQYAPDPMMVPSSSVFLALPSVYQMAFAFCHFSLAFVYLSKEVCPQVDAHGLTSLACTSNSRKGLRKGWYGKWSYTGHLLTAA